jgi:DNA (cytosine-5)-methyltransferase 1
VGIQFVDALRPKAVMFENVKGILSPRFDEYRLKLSDELNRLGYVSEWKILQASHFGVPQYRPRAILVAMQRKHWTNFAWPIGKPTSSTVGAKLKKLMGANNWSGLDDWRNRANAIAPTIVGGSKKHGGPDLGPARSKQAWLELGVDGSKIAEAAPAKFFMGTPQLTTQMVARLQDFPADWKFFGPKTVAYRQIGNAFPRSVAFAVAVQIKIALGGAAS